MVDKAQVRLACFWPILIKEASFHASSAVLQVYDHKLAGCPAHFLLLRARLQSPGSGQPVGACHRGV